MIVSLRRWMYLAKFLTAFLVLTYMLFHALQLLSGWIEPTQRYKEPNGRAVKVFQPGAADDASASMTERLKFFYWYGE